MATKVVRSIKEINAEVKLLDTNIKQATKENRELDKSLKIDPKNTTLLAQRMDNLKKASASAAEKVAILRKEQAKLSEEVKSGKATEDEYKKISVAVAKAETQVKSLNKQIKDSSKLNLDKLENSFKSISKTLLKIVAGIAGVTLAFAKTGDDIQKASERYRISAEEFQKGAFIFDRATDEADAYKATLETVTTTLASLNRGSAKTVATFEQLGLSAENFKGKSPAQAIEIITSALSKFSDVEERAAMATMLLGNNGTYLSQVAGLTNEEILALNETLEQNGIITSEEAAKAAELNDKYTDMTLKLKKVTAEIGVALIPITEALISVFNVLIPVIDFIAKLIGSMPSGLLTIITFSLLFLIILPKIIALVKIATAVIAAVKGAIIAVNGAMLLLGANPMAVKIMLIAAAVALLIFLLVELAKWIAKIFGKKIEFDIGVPNLKEISSFDGVSSGIATSTNGAVASNYQTNTSNVTNNYYDHSTMNNTVNSQMDIDDIAEQLSVKAKVGGAR